VTLSNLLTLRVDFRDEQAAARITPEQANAYLAARGWRRGDLAPWHQHRREQYEIMVPMHATYVDYGRRMVELLNHLARIEGRGVLAVFVEMVAAETRGD